MATLMRSSNPALNEKAFKGQVTFGEAMTLQGTVQQDGLSPALCRGHGCVDLGPVTLAGAGSGCPVDDWRHFRRLHRRPGYDL